VRSRDHERSTSTAWRSRIVGSGEEAPEQLLANPLNWRTHPGAQRAAIRGSLSSVGWVAQVIVNRTTGHVVDGHARIEEAISAGVQSVPVLYVELSAEEERLVLATLDPIGAMAERDDERLAELLADLQADDPGLQALLDSLASPEPKIGLTDPDDVPPMAETKIKAGDRFALGDHRLMCGDATSPDDLARLLDHEQVDCIWTDPPYGVEYVGKTARALTLDNDGEVSGPGVFRGMLEAVSGRLIECAPLYSAVPAGPRNADFRAALSETGWRLHQELVWVKDTFVLGHSDYHYGHEPILYAYAPGAGRPGRGKHEGSRWFGGNAQSSVLAFDRPRRSEDHPTMKPTGLVEACLRNSSLARSVVLDPFLGSGTTLVAAERLGRRCYGLELNPQYIAVAVRRWEDFTGRKAEQI
jgi:DNA modification methylase